jgi:ParB family chromosome partitioning protein
MVVKQVRCTDIRAEGGASRETTAGLDALVESIRSHGVLRPVLLKSTDDGYVIVHGERRWRAARAIGLERIPAFLVDELKSEATLEA